MKNTNLSLLLGVIVDHEIIGEADDKATHTVIVDDEVIKKPMSFHKKISSPQAFRLMERLSIGILKSGISFALPSLFSRTSLALLSLFSRSSLALLSLFLRSTFALAILKGMVERR